MFTAEYFNDPGEFPEDEAAPRFYVMGWEWARHVMGIGNMEYPWQEDKHNATYKLTLEYKQFIDGYFSYMDKT